MKRKIILIGIIILIFTNSNVTAQNRKRGIRDNVENLDNPFRFGGKLGINIATTPTHLKINTDFNETRNVKSNTTYFISFYAGFLTEYAFKNKDLKMQAEIIYSRNGSRYSRNGSRYSRNGSRHNTNSYIRIDEFLVPIVIKYNIFDNYDINIYGGIYTGYIFKAIGTENYKDAPKYNITNQYNSFDSGLVIGIDYTISDHIMVDARFNYGFLNIAKTSTATVQIGSELTSYNRFFNIGINIIP